MPKSLGLDLVPVWNNLDILVRGLLTGLEVAAVAILLATVLGLAVALASVSPLRPLRWLAFAYTQVFRGISLYVLIIWVYFGLAVALGVRFTTFSTGVVAIALLNSGYLAEVFRAAIQAVDRGQVEAARALGLSNYQVFRRVVGPQALRIALPPSSNYYVDAIKESSILSAIGLNELMRETSRFADFYFSPFEFYTAAAVLYLVAVFAVSAAFRWLERRLDVSRPRTPRARRKLDLVMAESTGV